MELDKWDFRLVGIAREVALWSKDPGEGVGAVLVSPDRRQVSWGYNGLPRLVEDSHARLQDREVRRHLTVHAELNALLNCPHDVTGWTLYCTKFPCASKCCAQAIIQRRVARVVCAEIDHESSWATDQMTALGLMHEAGVEVVTFCGGLTT
jgi:dCMP deaminase